MLIYQFDAMGMFTGTVEERDTKLLGLPFRFTDVPVPQHADSDFVQWTGAGWEVSQANPLASLLAERRLRDRDLYMDEVRELRMQLLNVLAGIALALDMVPEFKACRQLLLDLPQCPAVAAATSREEAEVAVKAEYARIVASTPDALRIAFKEIQP